MDKGSGEIKNFKEGTNIPKGWVLVPKVGTKVKVLHKTKLRHGVNVTQTLDAVVLEIINGSPGKLILEMAPEPKS